MIPYIPISEETAKALANGHQGPPKPVPMWKRAAAASVRGLVYVLLSPMLLMLAIPVAVEWAFQMKDES